jgi:hypothetical protein
MKMDTRKSISVFKGVWIIGSLIISLVFAFSVYPEVYKSRNNNYFTLYFYDGNKKIYHVNDHYHRVKYLDSATERNKLAFDACQILPVSEISKCSPNSNWYSFPLERFGCTQLSSCKVDEVMLSGKEIKNYVNRLTAVEGKTLNIKEVKEKELSYSNIEQWGMAARWPLFFMLFFMAVKIGRAFGEFMFKPYEES